MKNLFVLLLLLAFTFGCKDPSDSDASSTAPAPEEQSQAAEGATDETPDSAVDEAPEALDDATPEGAANDAAEDEEVADSLGDDIRVESELTLEFAGNQPRRKLFYDFEKVQPMTVEARTEVDTTAQEHHIVIPRVVQRMAVTDLARSKDTVAVTIQSESPSYESRDSGEMHKMLLESMREAEDVGQIRFSFDMDALGNVSKPKIIETSGSLDDAKPVVTGQMRQFASAYPAEAVGKGAKWQTTSRIDIGADLTIDTVLHYTLTKLTDDGAVLDMRYDIDDISNSLNEATEGSNSRIIDATMRGEGTLTIRFDQLLPTIDQTIVLDMTLEEAGVEMKSSIKMRTQIVAVD